MDQAGKTKLEQGGFLLFLALVTLATMAVVLPFWGPLLWATLAAIMFQPLYGWFLKRSPGKESRAAGLTLLVILIAVVIPSVWIGSHVVREAAGLVIAFREGRIDLAQYFEQIFSALPGSVQANLDESGFGNFSEFLQRAQEFLQDNLGLIAQQAIAIGGSVFGFVLAFAIGLYVSYFLIRDGKALGDKVLGAMPLERGVADRMADRFLSIVRATIKGSIVVGLAQGTLGAITFWIVGIPSVILLGVVMAIASLLPAIGPAIVWGPAAIYLLATGAIWEGVVVLVSGVALIGMVDNVLRPVLVGRDTGIPDWVILVTTLGGIALLGLSGIVVGPLVAGLFIAGWTTLAEQREAASA